MRQRDNEPARGALAAHPGLGAGYRRATLEGDALTALIVTIMLIPQALAYALLAGLPPEAGLFALIEPIFLYTILGTSPVLAVAPVAVVSLMMAATIGQLAEAGRRDMRRPR